MSGSELSAVTPEPVTRVAALGGGLIGRSWTALFLAAGKTVTLFDPDPTAEVNVRPVRAAAERCCHPPPFRADAGR